MKKNMPMVIFVIILIAVVITAISIVACSYNKNKTITPDVISKDVLSDLDKQKIKEKYNTEASKRDFIELCEKIELVIANKLLDGSVTNEEQLVSKTNDINKILSGTNWSYLEIEFPSFWIGKWQIDNKGILHFSFDSKEITPDWVKDKNIKKYII